MEVKYRYADIEELEFLVGMRLRDLRMFSGKPVDSETIENIRNFYNLKMMKKECFTLLGLKANEVIATATLYYYDILPSNDNPRGKIAQLTNVWVADVFRRQGIARVMIQKLMKKAAGEVGMICLNSSNAALKLYEGLGFRKKEKYLVYSFQNRV